jgi:hypothetical protein
VSSANGDLANLETLQMARNVDPNGKCLVLVLMDHVMLAKMYVHSYKVHNSFNGVGIRNFEMTTIVKS